MEGSQTCSLSTVSLTPEPLHHQTTEHYVQNDTMTLLTRVEEHCSIADFYHTRQTVFTSNYSTCSNQQQQVSPALFVIFFITFLYLGPGQSRLAGRIMFLTGLFARYQIGVHDILKNNEPILMQIGDKTINTGGQEVKGQGHRWP